MNLEKTKQRRDGQVPKLVKGKDVRQVRLSQEEAFLLSRVDGVASKDEIVQMSGLPMEKANFLLDGLFEKGLISWQEGVPSTETKADDGTAPPADSNAPWLTMNFPPALLQEDVDLDPVAKRKILYLSQKLEELTHYQFLDLNRRADAKEVRKGYFNVSREYHPDSYFRKKLGSFQSMVENIFKRINRAYEVLSDSEKRKAYDATLPYEPTPEELQADRRAQELKQRDEQLRQERQQRWLKRIPREKNRTQAADHYQEALNHKKNNDLTKAANCLRLALALDPGNQSYQKLLSEVEPKAGQLRSEKDYKRGRFEESVGRQDEALKSYLRAVEAYPDDSRSLQRAAFLMLALKRDLRQAVSFCRKAQQSEPENSEIVLTLAEAYLALGMNKNALREFARYLEMKPMDETMQARYKELKKTLG